jgi:hypothetical protein
MQGGGKLILTTSQHFERLGPTTSDVMIQVREGIHFWQKQTTQCPARSSVYPNGLDMSQIPLVNLQSRRTLERLITNPTVVPLNLGHDANHVI